MTRILHVSDTHAQRETLASLEQLVRELADVEVLAHTGDLAAIPELALRLGWDDWPQQKKLSVPGTHDGLLTYKRLSSWQHRDPPWGCVIGDLAFIGLDTSKGLVPFPKIDNLIPKKDRHRFAGVVILIHAFFVRPFKNPDAMDSIRVGESILALSRGSPVLLLHGHDHNEGEGLVWDEKTRLGALTFYRSNVYSSHSIRRGCGHLITWNGQAFSCEERQG